MSKILKHLVANALAGFFVLLPFGFIVFVILQAFIALRGLADQLAESQLENVKIHPLLIPLGVALALFILLYVVGALLASRRGRLGSWLEENFLNYVPGFLLVKGLAKGLVGMTADQGIRPALLEQLPGIGELVLIMDELPDDRYTVFAPTSPNAGSGKVLVVRRDKVKPLSGSLMQLRETLSLFGMGAAQLYDPGSKTQP